MERIWVTKGEKVLYKENECIIIRILDINTVSIEEVGSHIIHTVPVSQLSPCLEQPNQMPSIDSLSEKEWKKAQYRYSIIQPILENRGDILTVKETSEKHKVSIPTLYRWVKIFRESGLVSSLVGKRKTGGAGKSRLSKTQETIINEKILSVYLNSSRKSITKTIQEVQLACDEIGVSPPHPNTIRNRIKDISEEERVRKRLGIQAAKYKFEPHKGNFPGADHPLSVVQIDHTLLDIILVDEYHRKPYKRPWITVAIDVFSRTVLGFYLSFDPPGSIGTGMCIANAILPKEVWLDRMGVKTSWPCWGVMDTIHVDNAKEFHGNSLRKACQNYGINLQFRPIGSPHWGGHIERLLGTFSKEIHNLPGTTFSSEADRKDYDSEKNASFTISEVEKWLAIYITKVYHERRHSSIGMSPLQKFREGIMGTETVSGRGIPPRIFQERRVRLDFMPYVERTIQEYGVVIDHIHYYDDVLRPYIHDSQNSKTPVRHLFKRDPRDLSVIYFYSPHQDDYFDIPYRNTSLSPLSIWEYRDVVKKLKSNRLPINEESIFEAYRELNELERRAIQNTRKRKKEHHEELKRPEQSNLQDFINSTFEGTANETITPFDDIEDEALTRHH